MEAGRIEEFHVRLSGFAAAERIYMQPDGMRIAVKQQAGIAAGGFRDHFVNPLRALALDDFAGNIFAVHFQREAADKNILRQFDIRDKFGVIAAGIIFNLQPDAVFDRAVAEMLDFRLRGGDGYLRIGQMFLQAGEALPGKTPHLSER